MNNSLNIATMEVVNIEKTIEAIKNKLEEIGKTSNKSVVAANLNINKNYFQDLKKKNNRACNVYKRI
jgi:hypothetical protein